MINSSSETKKKLQNLMVILIMVLLAAVPFHALLVVGWRSLFGDSTIIAIWKELLILIITAGSLVLVWPTLKKQGLRVFFRRPDTALVMLIAVAGLAANIVTNDFDIAMLAGIKTTFLPLILFLAVQPVAKQISERRLAWVVLVPAVVVAGLAILQFVVVPTGFLASIGYGADTILPFQSVHPGFPFGRSFSTLGGPNQLGSYLILPLGISLGLAINSRSSKLRWAASIATVVFGVAALTSFSRSSLVGIGVSAIIVLMLSVPKKYRLLTGAALAIVVLITGMVFWQTVTNDNVTAIDRYLVRGELTTQGVVGGDEGHISALAVGATKIMANPGGLGFGGAGPASFYGSRPLVTENWYLQIALEVGVLGLLLMLFLLVRILMRIYSSGASDPLRIGFVAAGCGILAAAMFLHTLADSTLAILFFGTAGILYATKKPHEARL